MTVGTLFKSRLRQAITAYSIRSRRRKATRIIDWMHLHGVKTVLMVGYLNVEPGSNEGIVEEAVLEQAELKMAINIHAVETSLPFMVADARDMPFEDDYVDFALANAIIEHVGDEADQRRFVAEHCRVARGWVITTPNKWFPVESHTAVMFLHWFPRWRARRAEFTRLLSLREFKALLPPGTQVHGRPWSATFSATYWA